MRKFMIFYFIGTIASAAHTEYYPSSQEGYNNRRQQVELSYQTPPPPETEFFTFSAPDDYNDSKDVQRLSGILRPQRVVFIRSPEKNIFSITAEQLSKKDSLNVFVLRRETNTQGLLSQLDEVRQRVAQKPNVHFIKYRTPEDIDRAKQAIYGDFQSIPGTSHYHEDTDTPVYNFDSKSRQLYQNSKDSTADSPVIFKIIKHYSPGQDGQKPNATMEAEDHQYLPPSR